MKRRNFIFDIFSVGIVSAMSTRLRAVNLNFTPMVRSISTWKTTKANQKAGQMLDKGEHALDAAVAGVAIEEENPKNKKCQAICHHKSWFLSFLHNSDGKINQKFMDEKFILNSKDGYHL